MMTAAEGFNKHVRRDVDGRHAALEKANATGASVFRRADNGPSEDAYEHGLREQLAVAYGVVRSQIPGHNPAHAKLPAFNQ